MMILEYSRNQALFLLLFVCIQLELDICGGNKSFIRRSASTHSNNESFIDYPSFGKICESNEECVFKLFHLQFHNEIGFICKNGECLCKRNDLSGDETYYISSNVIWDSDLKLCKASEFSICGETNGLQVDCQIGLLCIQSRCRNPRKLQQGQIAKPCFDNVDCQRNLTCSVNERSPLRQAHVCSIKKHPIRIGKKIINKQIESSTVLSIQSTNKETLLAPRNNKFPLKEKTSRSNFRSDRSEYIQDPNSITNLYNKQSSLSNISSNSNFIYESDDLATVFIRPTKKKASSGGCPFKKPKIDIFKSFFLLCILFLNS